MAVSTAFTSAGTQLYIGTAPATYDLTGFAAVTFTQIAEIVDLGTVGKKYTVVKHNPIGSRQTVKRKGSFDNGTMTLKMAKTSGSDAGQTLLLTASDSDASYSYKMVLQNGTIMYFTAQASSFETVVSTVDTITSLNVTLELDNNILVA